MDWGWGGLFPPPTFSHTHIDTPDTHAHEGGANTALYLMNRQEREKEREREGGKCSYRMPIYTSMHENVGC